MDECDVEVFDDLVDVEDEVDGTKSPVESDGEDEEPREEDHSDSAEAEVPELVEELPKAEPPRKEAVRTTEPRLTKYECVRILGARAMQLAHGAPHNICPSTFHAGAGPMEVAVLELEQGRTPFLLRRPLPCGTHEVWRVSELVTGPGDVHPIVRTATAYYQTLRGS